MDEGSGLDYMRARYYSPNAGRFMNQDPIGQIGGVNIYKYSLNNPVNFIDPKGENPLAIIGGAIVGGAIVGAVVNSAVYLSDVIKGNEKFNWQKLGDQALGGAIGGALGGGIGAAFVFAGVTGLPLIGASLIGTVGGALIADDIADGDPRRNAHYTDDAARNATIFNPRIFLDPLVFDLDGDGVELVDFQQSTALFDLNADGFREQTGWIKGDDGLLALDGNNNGKIDNIIELFGDAITDGFDEL